MTSRAPGDRLRFHRDPVRMFFSAGAWAAPAYLASGLVVGPVLFAVALVALVTAAVLVLTPVGLPWLIGSALVVRGCARVERLRARQVGAAIPAEYRRVTGRGLFAQARTRWTDRATYRDAACLVVLFVPLLGLDLVVLVLWLSVIGLVTVPLWYWSIPRTWDDTGVHTHGVVLGYLPNGPDRSDGGFGVWIGSLPAALVTAAVCAVLALFAAYLVVGAARVHLAVARTLLGPYVDPLAAAKKMLAEPGPLIVQPGVIGERTAGQPEWDSGGRPKLSGI